MFKEGEQVRVKLTGEIGTILQVGANDGENYVVDIDGTEYVCAADFLQAVEIGIDIDSICTENEIDNEELELIDFIEPSQVDTDSAFIRGTSTQMYLQRWNKLINAVDNRDLPKELEIKYNAVGQLMEEIIDIEFGVIREV